MADPGAPAPQGEARCACGLPLCPPPNARVWWPGRGEDPGARARAITCYGADPRRLRWVRVGAERTRPDASCSESEWAQACGKVDWLVSAPMTWPRVGLCAAGTAHAVVPAWRNDSSDWTVEGSDLDAAQRERLARLRRASDLETVGAYERAREVRAGGQAGSGGGCGTADEKGARRAVRARAAGVGGSAGSAARAAPVSPGGAHGDTPRVLGEDKRREEQR